jgi:hypothetical protein
LGHVYGARAKSGPGLKKTNKKGPALRQGLFKLAMLGLACYFDW